MNAPFPTPKPETAKRVRQPQKRQQKPAPEKPNPIELLLMLEARVRDAETLVELQYLVANEGRKLIGCRQVIVHTGPLKAKSWRISKISSVAEVDPNAPLVVWLEAEIAKSLSADNRLGLKRYILPAPPAAFSYPFSHVLTVQLKDREGRVLGGISFAHEKPLTEHDAQLASRFAATVAHAWAALSPKQKWMGRLRSKRAAILITTGLFLLGCIPVPLTVLAPAQVVAQDAKLVAAPLQGVIEDIFVKPDMYVEKGELLFRFNQIEQINNLELREKELAVTLARFQRASQSAFSSGEGRKELAITKAELDVAKAERDYASLQLAQTEVFAPANGIALFSGKDEWKGRPVSIGERIMRLADPEKQELQIELPVDDAVILTQKISAQVFLDADPLNPRSVQVFRRGYAPESFDERPMAFPLRASFDQTSEPLRIGWRGTAQISGETVPLAYNLFRKPLAKMRQYIGL